MSMGRSEAVRIFESVKAELNRRGHVSIAQTVGQSTHRPEAPPINPILSPWLGSRQVLPQKNDYQLDELLRFSDRAFVINAYQALLHRAPDIEGLSSYVEALRQDRLTKLDVLEQIWTSVEAQRIGVHVHHLSGSLKIQKLKRKKFIGPFVSWIHGIARSGRSDLLLNRVDGNANRETQDLAQFVNDLNYQIRREIESLSLGSETKFSKIEKDQFDLRQSLDVTEKMASQMHEEVAGIMQGLETNSRKFTVFQNDVFDRIELAQRSTANQAAEFGEQFSAQISAMNKLLNSLKEQVTALQHDKATLETQILAFEDRMTSISSTVELTQSSNEESFLKTQNHRESDLLRLDIVERDLAAHGEILGKRQKRRQVAREYSQKLEPMYVAFEDRFRGSSEIIRERALPFVEILRTANAGTRVRPILDLGSGNGDFLQLLKDEGMYAEGVEMNASFASISEARGLKVHHTDALTYLNGISSDSVGAITGMHIVEHLPMPILMEILSECYRVLHAGGIVAFETPNPENILVGSLNFYVDPTHLNPLPPVTLQWLVESVGFQNAEIRRLSEGRPSEMPPVLPQDDPYASTLNPILERFNIAPDYAVVARKL